jgi:hypothetical protein
MPNKPPPKIDTPNARSKLAKQGKPYWHQLEPGLSLGYRAGPGSWSVRAADGKGGNWIKSLEAVADDGDKKADNVGVLDFGHASEKARKLARGGDGVVSGSPVTVDQALSDYAEDLKAHGGSLVNVTHPRFHLQDEPLLFKVVSLTTTKEWSKWRNGLLDKGLKPASVNRLCKGLKAALTLAASHDARIGNTTAWTKGLAALPEDDDEEDADNVEDKILTDEQRRDLVAGAYTVSAEFGLYIETHTVGARSSQIFRLNVGDLEVGNAPLLRMPGSKKGGRKRKTRGKKPMPISIGLARRLQRAAAGRPRNAPLLLTEDGQRWRSSMHFRPFGRAVKAAGLPENVTAYFLRHTEITRKLLAGVPTRLVAATFDTSIQMIEKTYSKFIADHGDALMRVAVFDADVPPGTDNVLRLAKR